METINPSKTDFLVLPISGSDLFLAYRFDGVRYKRLVVNYKELINSIVSLVGTGSDVTLQVNSVNNLVQNKLDLKNGTNISIVDNGDGSVTINSIGGGSGTVTSVTINASNALSATGNPITTSGAITLGWTGTNLQFVRGDGTLATILTNLSQFTNDVGFITSAALAPYLTSAAAAATYVPLTRNITIQGVTQNLSSDVIYYFPSLPLNGGMYIERSYLNPDTAPVTVLYIQSVNKVYVANNSSNTIRIFNASTGVLLASITLSGATHLHHLTGVANPEIWAFGTTAATTISRINITPIGTPESIVGTITGFSGNLVAAGFSNDVLTISPTKVYVSQFANNTQSIAIVNPVTNTITGYVSGTSVGGIVENVGLVLNTNSTSAMNNIVVQARHSGLGIVNTATDTMTVVNSQSAIANSNRNIKYVASKDIYIVPAQGSARVLILKPATASTFTELHRIDQIFAPSDVFVNEADNVFFVSHIVSINNVAVITAFDLNTYQPLYQFQTNITPTVRTKMSGNIATREIFLCAGGGVNNTFLKIRY